MVNERFEILVISGATASGKSALALGTALEKNGVVINADAMQLYSELPILSAQPSKSDQKLAPHFLYSVLKHNENSSMAAWLGLAVGQINLALKNNQLPIVVGGTGLYISKLMDGINEVPAIDDEVQKEVRSLAREDLLKILIDLGDSKELVEKLDRQRLSRRLEVLKQTGKTLSWWQNQPNKIFYPKEYFKHINIELPRDQLYSNCNKRLEIMFENGAVNEVENLVKQAPDKDSLVTKTIGYEEIKDYLAGKISKEQAIEIASQKTRNYAKRQLTWFRNQFPKPDTSLTINN
jgi:tRNA dimethylallyltransferase